MHEAFAWQRTKGLNRLSQKALLGGVLCVLVGTFLMLYCLYCSEFGVNPFQPEKLDGQQLRKQNKQLDTSFVFQASLIHRRCSDELCGVRSQGFALLVALTMPPLIEKVLACFDPLWIASEALDSGGILLQYSDSLLGCRVSSDCVVHSDGDTLSSCLGGSPRSSPNPKSYLCYAWYTVIHQLHLQHPESSSV